ncbi:MAG: RDD family protein, partial [Candidatus Limnocylindrales bacterium]
LNSVPQATLDALGRGMYSVDPTTGQLFVNPAAYTAYFAAINSLLPLALGVTVLLGLLQMVYFAFFWSRRGASLGQLALGVQVRNERDGSRISFGRGCLRYLGMIVSIYVLYIGLIWAAFDARKQGWHDKIAGTVAIRRVH